MKYFIANWKANKNLQDAEDWVDRFLKLYSPHDGITVIICPPFPLIAPLKEIVKDHSIVIGCQDISLYDQGTYTGEVPAYSVASLADYAIIGHSERKKYFHETDDDVKQKYLLAKKYGIQPIYCVAAKDMPYPPDLEILCYEPPTAISSGDGRGNFESVEDVIAAKKSLNPEAGMKFIYGGSVNRDNATMYLKSNEIDGFLVGGASLDPEHFFKIVSA